VVGSRGRRPRPFDELRVVPSEVERGARSEVGNITGPLHPE
jgi:hypothetical protein